MARPEMHPDEKRTARFNMRFTVAEKIHIETQSRIAGLGPHEYCRRRALGYTVPPAPSQSRVDTGTVHELNNLWRQLQAIGNNANQLALASNAGRQSKISWEAVVERIHALGNEVETVLERLVDDHD